MPTINYVSTLYSILNQQHKTLSICLQIKSLLLFLILNLELTLLKQSHIGVTLASNKPVSIIEQLTGIQSSDDIKLIINLFNRLA